MSSDNACTSSSVIRPMLPPLHTLGLPTLQDFNDRSPSGLDDSPTPMPRDFIRWHRARQSSISSTTSSCTSTTSTETPLNAIPVCNRDSPTPPPNHVSTNSFSLVLTSFEKANAFVVVPPPQQYVPGISSLARASASVSPSKPKSRRNQALLLVGPAVEYLRHPRMRIAKGARVHPYRIVPNTPKRSSTSPEPSSTTSPL
ncbi:hypothetical protein BDW22DRAFT_1352434 [Trametopsis cervina]|nr:hypothetical protein BDW22DRAFT_1352434 [Trametopsis cervina]